MWWRGGWKEYFMCLGMMSKSLMLQRISVNDSFAQSSSQTLLGRFVFHTPTSLQTTPPLTPCLLISRLLSIFPTHSLRIISWLGLS